MQSSKYRVQNKNITNSKTYVFLIANNEQTIMIPIEKVLKERKSFPLIQNSYEKFNENFSHKYNQLMPGNEILRLDL